MGNVRDNLKRVYTDFSINAGRIMTGDLSMFDKADRRALMLGSVAGAILAPCAAFAEGEGDAGTGTDIVGNIGTAADTFWNIGLKILWILAACLALVALIWTIASGSKEVSKPLTWLRRIVLCVIGANVILTVIKWAKGINANSSSPSTLVSG